MVGNYFTLQALAAEASRILTNVRIAEAFSQDRAEVVFRFDEPVPRLVVSCRPESATLYFHTTFERAKKNSANVLLQAWGQRIESVSLHPTDRILLIALEGGLKLSAHLFGSSANIFLLSKDDVVQDAFQKSKGLIGTSLRIPASDRILDLEALHDLPHVLPGLTTLAAIRKLFPLIAQPLAEEALFRAGLSGTVLASTIDEESLTTLSMTVQQMLIELQHPDPRIYADEDTNRTVLSVIQLGSLSHLQEQRFSSVHEAVRSVVLRRRADKSLEERRSAIAGHIRQIVEKLRRSLSAVAMDVLNAERSAEYELFGSMLMNSPGMSKRGEKTALLDHDGRSLQVPLDPQLTQIQNAQRYFEKAKRAKTATAQSTERKSELEARILVGETLLAALADISTTSELKRTMTERADELEDFGIGEKGVTDPIPFRRFIVDGGFEVLAGKSSENNDKLTLHVAKPQDLWFHARGSSGSHVILRVSTGKGEPGKKAREQAAAIAAYYSKMRGAGLVPVAMTEKKYVRKPKGSKPGSVVLEREKVVFVRPGLPQTGSDK